MDRRSSLLSEFQSTSISLLDQLGSRDRSRADQAWERFSEIYVPMIYCWARHHGLDENDAPDLVQDVMLTLVKTLPGFEADPQQRFRGWLRTFTLNQARAWYRKRSRQDSWKQHAQGHATAEAFENAIDSDVGLFEKAEYEAFLVSRCSDLIAREFETQTWQAAWKYVSEDRTAADVAEELGMTPNAVRVAKCRVISRLKQELLQIID